MLTSCTWTLTNSWRSAACSSVVSSPHVCSRFRALKPKADSVLTITVSVKNLAKVKNKSWFSLQRGLRQLVADWTLEYESVKALVLTA